MHAALHVPLAVILFVLTAAAEGVSPAAADDVSARTLLAQLKVRDARETGYDRDKFGRWIDADRDGCDTRSELLIAEAKTKPKVRSGCDLANGYWVSPYDGKSYRNPTKLQIDHTVALSEAWKSGAYRWTNTTRQRFANDLGYGPSPVAVTSRLNMSKGDREPWQWLRRRSPTSAGTSPTGSR